MRCLRNQNLKVLVIVDYKAGNLRSVQRAFGEVGAEAKISGDPDVIRRADRLVFPGVGAAGAAMKSLRETGIDESIKEVFQSGKPILGICLGLQVSLDFSQENQTETLKLVTGEVNKFQFNQKGLKVPHMGWNSIRLMQSHPVLSEIEPDDEFYFVHSYYAVPEDDQSIFALTAYELEFASVIGKENFIATQFHPEKSGRVGLRLLNKFIGWSS